jgi:hypothetical protein
VAYLDGTVASSQKATVNKGLNDDTVSQNRVAGECGSDHSAGSVSKRDFHENKDVNNRRAYYISCNSFVPEIQLHHTYIDSLATIYWVGERLGIASRRADTRPTEHFQ